MRGRAGPGRFSGFIVSAYTEQFSGEILGYPTEGLTLLKTKVFDFLLFGKPDRGKTETVGRTGTSLAL